MAFGRSYVDSVGDESGGFNILTPYAFSNRYFYCRPAPTGLTVVRVLPAVLNGTILPERNSPKRGDFAEWIAALECITLGITGLRTFICQVPDPDKPGFVKSVDMADPPPNLLRTRLKRLADREDKYGYLLRHLNGSRGAPAAIPKTSRMGFVQGILFQKGAQQFRPCKQRQVIGLPTSARRAVESLCNEENPKEEWASHPDAQNRFKSAGWLAPDTGRVLIISRAADTQQGPADYTVNEAAVDAAPSGDGRTDFIQVYEAALGAESRINPEVIVNNWAPWDQLLKLYKPEEQVELMLQVIPAEIIRLGLGDQDYVPNKVKTGQTISVPSGASSTNGSATAQVGGGGPPDVGAPQFPDQVSTLTHGSGAMSYDVQEVQSTELPLSTEQPTGPPATVLPATAVPAANLDPATAPARTQDILSKLQKGMASVRNAGAPAPAAPSGFDVS